MYILKKTPKKAVAKDKDSASTSNNNSGTNNAADDVTITSTTTDGNNSSSNSNSTSKPTTSSFRRSQHQQRHAQVCGCLATKHKFIGSCMACGRIKCEEEARIPNCPHCDTYIVKPMNAEAAAAYGFDEDTLKAYRHKVR
jgi:hypothetical protein